MYYLGLGYHRFFFIFHPREGPPLKLQKKVSGQPRKPVVNGACHKRCANANRYNVLAINAKEGMMPQVYTDKNFHTERSRNDVGTPREKWNEDLIFKSRRHRCESVI